MKTAKLVATLPPNDVGAVWKIYEVDPPMDTGDGTTKHVVASAVNAMFSGPEVYLFPVEKQDDDWHVTNWCELDGSYRGGYDHAVALENAGYEVTA